MRVVLASGSPRRRDLLAALVQRFDVAAADIDEPLGSDAVGDALALAARKAEHIARQEAGAVVVGADTIVFDGSVLYGKPADAEEARAMLRDLGGRAHTVVTGVAVAVDGRVIAEASVSTVTMRALSDRDIDRYVGTGVPLDKAGAYAIQHDGFPVVDRYEGCYCNVVGLPLWRLKGLLERAGVACDDPAATFERCGGCPDRPSPA